MRTVAHARAKAREYRALLSGAPSELADRIVSHLADHFQIEVVGLSTEHMQGSLGEIQPGSGILRYDDSLQPSDRLALFAHELGHLVLHARLTDSAHPADPILGSAYAEAGPAAIARYSPRAIEEAEATAFATELTCPSSQVFQEWLESAAVKSSDLAARYGVTLATMHAQLAQGLHELALGSGKADSKKHRSLTLTKSQQEAAEHTGSPALVDAGPGTGKTATLVERVRFLLKNKGANAAEILILTFSNEAAQELRARVESSLGAEAAKAMTIATFHGFGMSFLHSHGHLIGYDTDFALLDEDAQDVFISDLVGRVPTKHLVTLSDMSTTIEAIADHINFCKQRLRDVETLERAIASWTPEAGEKTKTRAQSAELAGIYREYEQSKHSGKRVDLADLILLPVQILGAHPEVAAAYRTKYPWVLVDEFQDVTRATSRLLQLLCDERNPPWVVGDARQAIYRFLGAAPENVSEFAQDFPAAVTFELVDNYRSCPEVVEAANELAAILANPTSSAEVTGQGRWRAATQTKPIGRLPIAIAEAESDHAERAGIAEQVRIWIADENVAPGDIAVLARRNIDVRNIVSALAARGIRAQASGLLTAEGPAGDLAAVTTLIDVPRPSIPRLAIAVGRGRASVDVVNAVVRSALSDGTEQALMSDIGNDLAAEMNQIQEFLRHNAASADGFALLATFLFDSGEYLRRICTSSETAERSMALVEIVSTLSLAVSYRVTHPFVTPRAARLGFAERLRQRLTKATPLQMQSHACEDAVRVMTCHAAKGLEFPCVIVAGQTVPRHRERFPWLPPSWRPTEDVDVQQGNALLFVGVTRAQRAAVVSFPKKAGEGNRAQTKTVVALLAKWREQKSVQTLVWSEGGDIAMEVSTGPIWGGASPATVSLNSLDANTCAIRTYLQGFLAADFPVLMPPLYPKYVGIARQVLRAIVDETVRTGQQVGSAVAGEMAAQAWGASGSQDHPHATIYETALTDAAKKFVSITANMAGATQLDPALAVLTPASGAVARLDLVGHYRTANGDVIAISFRSESLAEKAKPDSILWSKLSGKKRMSFVLLESLRPGVKPYLYSGEDGALYEYKWSQDEKSLLTEAGRLRDRHSALSRMEFTTKPTSFACDSCSCRVNCPVWNEMIL